ncbi:MAG: phospholipase D-like domain-containing protein [Lachnospiraceae bacterium]|nr:phospholipase D-like domain-containing protein [Lachnospiraceae bacterium]
MFHEIDLGNDNKLILFKNEDFWNSILPKTFEESKWIDVVTYNFNFNNYSEKSFYNKLKDLASKGISIRLVYAKETYSNNEKALVEEVFKSFVLCAKLEDNHSKIFLSNNIAYVGSANFSFHSNSNYECGIIIRNAKTIQKIRKSFLTELVSSSKFTLVPTNPFDPLHDIDDLFDVIESILPLLYRDKTCIIEKNNLELIPELRIWDDVTKILSKSAIDFEYEFTHSFSWEKFYFCYYHSKSISEEDFIELCDFVLNFSQHLHKLKNNLIKSYTIHGKENVIPLK